MLILIILLALPGLFFPALLPGAASPDIITRTLTWLYPLYTLLTAALAWGCWRTGRHTMTWILLALLLLSHLCIYLLSFIPIS